MVSGEETADLVMRGFKDFWGPSVCFIIAMHGKDDGGDDGDDGDDGGNGVTESFLHTPFE